MKQERFTTHKIVFIALMAALVFVLTMFRFPLLNSKVHFANAMCLLSGLLLGPIGGGLAAGIGSGLYDLVGGYGLDGVIITIVSKFLMALICGLIAKTVHETQMPKTEAHLRVTLGSIIGALSYVALYMLKTVVYQAFVYGYPAETVWATALSKLPASLINAVFAMIVTPILYAALRSPLEKTGLLEKMR